MSMLRPVLFIGVGGSGGKTIRSIKQTLNRKLESARYEGGIPAAWQFLQIDTTYDGVAFPAPMLPQDEFHCVVPRGNDFRDILASITNSGTLADQQNMLAGWGVPNSVINIPMGAGQIRAIGRQVGVADSAKTLQAIQGAIAKMSSPSALGEFGEVANALGATPYPQPQAFIISSFAGGSGAGMFMDVAELLKRATPQNWAQHAISFLYTPEVFSSLGAAGRDVAKNSLGVMNELIASRWVGISERSEFLYSKLGLASGNNAFKGEYGCKTNFLIGTRNDQGLDISWGADGAGMDEVFLTVGDALASAISDDEISDFLTHYAFIGVSGYRPALDMSGLAPESVNGNNTTLAAAGIGFGQLTLGADRIVNYVADAMSRAQVKKLLWPELATTLWKDGVSASELIQQKSDQVWPNFLVHSGLDQRGSQNQITDALLPDHLQNQIKDHVGGLIKKNVTSAPMPIATFAKAVWYQWEIESDEFLKLAQFEMNKRAQVWVPEIQEKLRDLVATELALNGYAVLTNLTERLETELREHVIPELMRDHTEFANALSGFDTRAFVVRLDDIAEGLASVSAQNGAFLEKVSHLFSRVIEFNIKSYVSNLAALLVEDMVSCLIEPLKYRLADSRTVLQTQQKSTISPNGSRNFYPNFPVWGSANVPNRYKSSTIERILIDSADYESTYEFYASKDLNGAPPFQQSISSSLLGRRMNPMPGAKNEQTLITVGNRWTTSVRDAQAQMGETASKSDWTFHTDLAELSDNNRRWLRIQDSSFGKFTDMSIREFVLALGESPVIRAGREVKFITEFAAMWKAASPLISLNYKASAHITPVKIKASDAFLAGPGFEGSAFETLFTSSKIPFEMSSNVGLACIGVLQQQGCNPNSPTFAAKWFDAGSNASTMFAVATHADSLPAWAFASLTEPILEQVAQSIHADPTWQQFWSGRRSRPLIEAVSFETEIRRSIITGWFIARIFGLVEIDFDKKLTRGSVLEPRPVSAEVAGFLRTQGLTLDERDRLREDTAQSSGPIFRAGRTVRVWNPTLQVPGWSGFPNPLLPTHREDERRQWVLPQLLVSAGIALAEFGKSGDPEFIYGYRLLKYLGREVTTTFDGRDHWDGRGSGDVLPTGATSKSTLIKEWIATGRKPDDSLDLLTPLQRKLDVNPDRRTALIATVEGLRAHYTEIWAEFSSTAWHDLPETWELKEDIDLALNDIIEYTKALQVGDQSSLSD